MIDKTKSVLIKELDELKRKYSFLKASFNKDYYDRLETEHSQKKNNDLIRLFTENSTDMISKQDANGVYLYVSPACHDLLGYEPNDLIGHSAVEFIHPDDIQQDEKFRLSITSKEVLSTIIYRILCKNGEYIWLETNNRTITDIKTGAISEIQSASRNISNQKLTQDALHEKEEHLRILVSNSPIITFSIDIEGIITLSEGLGLNKLGLKLDQVVGQSFFDVYKDYPSIIEVLKIAINGTEQHSQHTIRGIIFDAVFAPLKDHQGKVTKVIGVLNEITNHSKSK